MSNKRSLTMFIDRRNRIITPLSLQDLNNIIDFYDDGLKVTVTIEPYARTKELSQMGLFHAYVKYISDHTGDDKDSEKINMKKRYGVSNDDGTLKSLTKYTTTEMNTLIQGTFIFTTQFLGINVPTPEEWKTKNLK